MNRKKITAFNVISAITLELFTVISGFIIPRLIISSFGSDVNGLTLSIADFIGYITLLQTGVGSAIKVALYKPLAKKDHHTLSIIVKTTERFFFKIALASVVYIAALAFVFQPFLAEEFDYVFTASLVVIIGLGTAAQYFFGITYQMLLEADQKSYVYSAVQIVTIVFNTVAVLVAVNLGASIIIVKLCSAIFFVIRPIVLALYAKKRYKFDKTVQVDNRYIRERWNAFGQGIAFFLHSKTDIFVLTVLSTFSNVSIYSVYALVTKGLSSLLNAVEKAVRSAFGNIIANEENEYLQKSFKSYLSLVHIISTILFATASITVFNFVDVYTKNVSDATYYQPIFGLIIIAAELLYCLRLPYYTVIYAAGKFKETQVSSYIEAGLNIVLSVILVYKLGLIGVAIGTFVAMGYRTVAFVRYLHREIINLKYSEQIRRYLVTFMNYVAVIICSSLIKVTVDSYIEWFLYALCVCIAVSLFTISFNLILDHENTKEAFMFLIGRKLNDSKK